MSTNWQSIAETPLQSGEDMSRRIVDKAISDESFRAELLSNPKNAISTELGLDLPQDVNVVVHQSDPKTFHLSLPVTELDEESLEAIAAGRCCC
ncbi:MAG: NHLP leader peptide family natural product precursor [Gammaproteobacteria bacterium]|nr:NHLP leader peptide family natural product precursor [Gammaproteobacteria bacterium]